MNCAVPVLRLRRAKLVLVGTRVFGDEEKARQWARSPQPALDGAIPDELADTLAGHTLAMKPLLDATAVAALLGTSRAAAYREMKGRLGGDSDSFPND